MHTFLLPRASTDRWLIAAPAPIAWVVSFASMMCWRHLYFMSAKAVPSRCLVVEPVDDLVPSASAEPITLHLHVLATCEGSYAPHVSALACEASCHPQSHFYLSSSLSLLLFISSSLLLSSFTFSLLSSLLLIFSSLDLLFSCLSSSLVFHLLSSLFSSLLFSLFRLVVSSFSVFFLCLSPSLSPCVVLCVVAWCCVVCVCCVVLCCVVLCCVVLCCVLCCVCGVVCGATWHAEKTFVCRYRTSPCVPAPRPHVLPHAGVVPVHTGTF